MSGSHYVNLSRGELCLEDGCFPIDRHLRYVRIQSTWCEQKRWPQILDTLGADFYMSLARGANVIVHDVSERERQTRAMWQGLSWIRFACMKAWHDVHTSEFSRNGMRVSDYWLEQYHALPRTTLTMLGYYKQFRKPWPFMLRACMTSQTASIRKGNVNVSEGGVARQAVRSGSDLRSCPVGV